MAPVFSTEFTDRTDAEGAVISFDANATDANPGDTLTYSATNLPSGITINSSTGVVSGTLSRHVSSGSYAVVLTVSDGTPHRHRLASPGPSPSRAPVRRSTSTAPTTTSPSARRRAWACQTFTIETWFRRDGAGVAHLDRQRRRHRAPSRS